MKLSVLLLAAGQGRRFGSKPKQLALYSSSPLLAHTLALAEASAPGRVLLVLGAHAETIVQRMNLSNYLVHPQWADGLGASIGFGVRHLPADTDAVMILLADQVALTRDDIHLLRQCYECQDNSFHGSDPVTEKKIICAQYCHQLGVPAIFPRHYFSRLEALSGDRGAKALLLTEAVTPVFLPNAAVDIDTPEDLFKLNQSQESLCLN